jgi:hypothetical protein
VNYAGYYATCSQSKRKYASRISLSVETNFSTILRTEKRIPLKSMDSDDETGKPVFTGPKFNMPTKKYGLIIPSKGVANGPMAAKKAVKPCIFDEEEDEEGDCEGKGHKGVVDNRIAAVKAKTGNQKLKKQTQIEIEKALLEDPSVFEYDSVYDEMEKEKAKIDPSLKKNESREVAYLLIIYFLIFNKIV